MLKRKLINVQQFIIFLLEQITMRESLMKLSNNYYCTCLNVPKIHFCRQSHDNCPLSFRSQINIEPARQDPKLPSTGQRPIYRLPQNCSKANRIHSPSLVQTYAVDAP